MIVRLILLIEGSLLVRWRRCNGLCVKRILLVCHRSIVFWVLRRWILCQFETLLHFLCLLWVLNVNVLSLLTRLTVILMFLWWLRFYTIFLLDCRYFLQNVLQMCASVRNSKCLRIVLVLIQSCETFYELWWGNFWLWDTRWFWLGS